MDTNISHFKYPLEKSTNTFASKTHVLFFAVEFVFTNCCRMCTHLVCKMIHKCIFCYRELCVIRFLPSLQPVT